MNAAIFPIENRGSVRDQFAMAALQGLLAESVCDDDSSLSVMDEDFADQLAHAAFMIADAMMQRRKSK